MDTSDTSEKIAYCVCRKCWGDKIFSKDCPCKLCKTCFIHMGKDHLEQENKLEKDICEGCFRIKNVKINCDLRGFGLLLYGIYDRAYSAAVGIVEDDKDNALRWIKSESFKKNHRGVGLKLYA